MFTLPSLITLIRIAALPFLLLLFVAGQYTAVAVLFIIAALSDYADGWLARRMGLTSRLGAMLDQISDKLLVGAVLLLLASTGRFSAVGVMAATVILLREIWIAGLREYLGSTEIALPVSRVAKYKTTVQMAAQSLLLIALCFSFPIGKILWLGGEGALLAAAGLSVWTAASYTKAAWPHLRNNP